MIEKPIRSLREIALAFRENQVPKLNYFKSYFKLANSDIKKAAVLHKLLLKD